MLIDAVHMCVTSRGVNDTNSSTITTSFSGKFSEEKCKQEFLALIKV
ncbi:MAG TPA: GTP cyclohydrolase I [Bacteroidia bacterium]|nr:GTP cyclohydrolase I [Bacteroidia bacterium]